MARKKKVIPPIIKIDFPNDDGSVDEWVYDTKYNPMRVIEVTLNIRRRSKK